MNKIDHLLGKAVVIWYYNEKTGRNTDLIGVLHTSREFYVVEECLADDGGECTIEHKIKFRASRVKQVVDHNIFVS